MSYLIHCLSILTFLFGVLFVGNLSAEEISEKIARLNESASLIQGEIGQLKNQLGDSQKKIRELQKESGALRSSEEALQTELDHLAQELINIEGEIESLSIQVEELSERKWRRIRALDQTETASSFFDVISSKNTTVDYEDFLFLTARMQQKENEVVKEAREGMDQLVLKQTRESELLKSQKKTHEQIREDRAALSRVLLKRKGEEVRLKEKQEELKLKVIKLQGEALRLESILAGFMTASLTELKKKRPRKVLIETPKLNPQSSVLSGQLLSPVTGVIVKGFQKGEKASPHRKGILIEVDQERVVPIAHGIVSFCGKLPFFGEAVIIEHSDEEFSLYGGLHERKCALRQDVEAGKFELGRIKKGEKLYLELRRAGKPINPEPLLPNTASK